MRRFAVALALSALCAAAAPLLAQEGHPLKGSWTGTWEGNTVHGNSVLLVLDWDGKAITGTVNPGTDNMVVKNATLNPDGWVFHFEADGKDKAGAVITYVVDGKIENLAMHNRSIVGTWKSQRGSGAFKISRQ
jgi:hypothetical protein